MLLFFLAFTALTSCTLSTTPRRDISLEKPAAVVTKVTGSVRYKLAGSINWKNLDNLRFLYEDDLLFTEKNGSIKFEYFDVGADVTLPEQTIFRITRNPPVFTRLRRQFSSAQNEVQGKKLLKAFNRVIARTAGVNSESLTEQKQNTSVPSLSVNRDVENVKIEFPKVMTMIYAKSYPYELIVKLAKNRDAQNFWGYLWTKSQAIVPIWSGYTFSGILEVPIPKPGTYTFQVFAEDESEISKTLSIEAQMKKDGAVFEHLGGHKNEDVSVIIE